MSTAHVTKAFIDKNTGQKYLVGARYEGDNNRISELVEAGHAKKVDEPKVNEPQSEPKRRTRKKKQSQE